MRYRRFIASGVVFYLMDSIVIKHYTQEPLSNPVYVTMTLKWIQQTVRLVWLKVIL